MAEPVNRAYAARQKAAGGADKLPLGKAQELSEKDIEKARTQFETIYEAEKDLRARIKADHEFVDGVHADGKSMRWTQKEYSDRGDRPTFSIDAMGGPIAQVVNGIAESKPAADMVPIGGGADDEKAEVWEGLLRRIQTTPEAEYAGAWAGEHLVKIGWGGWAVTAKYPPYNGKPDDPANWEMELCRKWIENQHAVWLGASTEPDGSDRLCGFILQPLTEDLFDERLGEGEFKKNKDALQLLKVDGNASLTAWGNEKTITVATWYRIKSETVTLTGTGPDGQPVERTDTHRRCCVSTITATKEYDYSELPIPYVPIVWGVAKRSNVDGSRDVKGMVRPMKHAQEMLNYWASEIPAMIAMSSRQEVVAAAGQTENMPAAMWDMNKRLAGPRLYDPIEINGHFAPPPQIVNMEAPIQAMTIALQQAEAFVRKTGGFYDADSDQTRASLSKESGVARKVRQQQGEMGSSDFARAYAFMILFEIKLLLAWTPHVVTAARVQRITGRDEDDKVAVTHFGPEFASDAAEMAKGVPQKPGAGVMGVFDMSTGRYDMKARVTKNPLTERQENVEILTELLPVMPPEMQAKAFPVMLDEMEGTVMRRISAAINPKQQTISPADAQKAQQIMDEQARIINELKQRLDDKSEQDQSKERIALAEIDSKERIEGAKLDLERERMHHETKMKEYEMALAAAQAEFDAHQAQLASGREMVTGEMERQHARDEAQAGREHQTAEREGAEDFGAVQAQAGHLNQLELPLSRSLRRAREAPDVRVGRG